jgi:hypothetical protein
MANRAFFYFTICLPGIESNTFTVLPQGDGKLPVWQMVVAATALSNTVQNFLTLRFTKRLYNNVPAAQPGRSSTLVSRICSLC